MQFFYLNVRNNYLNGDWYVTNGSRGEMERWKNGMEK